MVRAWILVQWSPHCGRAGAARNGVRWPPCSSCGCWRWPDMGWDTALHFSFMIGSFGKSWMLFVIVSPLAEQRGDTVLADTRWNTNVAPYSGKLLILLLKVQTTGINKKCFTVNSGSVLETCIIFLSVTLSLILAGFIMFAHRGTFCAFIFPCDKGALLRP